MYFVMVTLLLLVLPAGSIAAEFSFAPAHGTLLFLIGQWFVFWAVGVRLFLAGIRQAVQPDYTARTIFRFESNEPLQIIQELGFANLAQGLLGLLTILRPGWILPAAIMGGFYYGLAGLKHARVKARTTHATFAMVSDLFVFLVLAFYVIATLTRP